MRRQELKNFIYECYVDYLVRQNNIVLMEDEAKDNDMIFGEGAQLPTATDEILAKFPTLKHALQRLHSDQWEEFIQGVQWVSPKPTIFRIQLSNGQDYTLKWMGQDFEADISGKKYYLGQVGAFQQALDKLALLYQEGPMGGEEEAEGGEDMGGDAPDFGGGGGGGADFPGGEEEGPEGGEEPGEEEGGEDMGDEDIDFETDTSI